MERTAVASYMGLPSRGDAHFYCFHSQFTHTLLDVALSLQLKTAPDAGRRGTDYYIMSVLENKCPKKNKIRCWQWLVGVQLKHTAQWSK